MKDWCNNMNSEIVRVVKCRDMQGEKCGFVMRRMQGR